MNTYDKLQAEKKMVTHWLHASISLITMGLWTPVWLFLAIRAKNHNAMVDVKMLGALAAMQDGRK